MRRTDGLTRACGLVALALCAWLCAGCATPETHRYTQIVMGVATTVSIVADDEAEARSAARVAFARLEELEQAMSDYRPSSELMRLCATHGVAVPVSDDLFAVLAAAERVAEASDGRFDCTIGPLSLLWREARRNGALPEQRAIDAARSRVGFQLVQLDAAARTALLRQAGIRIDFGGIGKGYAAARTIESLRAAGFPRALVAIAGDIAAGDPPPGLPGWSVAVECPDGSRTLVQLANRSVSTSGDREQVLLIGGERYSHIVDPRTGIGARLRRQVTVVGPDGAIVDALASVLAMSDGIDDADFDATLLARLAAERSDGPRGFEVIACPPPAQPSSR
jgi:FAD:protein FMN transferase